jgi:hypothetical protein
MADYYPLIARAVEGLSDQSPEMRRAVYERARTALVEQLRSLDPPLPDDDILRERHALDDAINRVEAIYVPEAVDTDLPSEPENFAQHVEPNAEPEQEPAAWDDGREGLPTAAGLAQAAGFDDEMAEAPDRMAASHEEPPPTARPRIDSRSPVVRSAGQGRAIALGAVLALVIAAIAVAAWFLRDMPGDMPAPAAVADAPQPRQAPEGAKISERVGGGPPPPSAPSPPPNAVAGPVQPGPRQDVGVAQRAVFYEEDPSNPQAPKTLVGRAVWRLEGVNAGQGQPLDTGVRAVVEFSEAGLTMNLLLRRNTDTTLPASHTVELNFVTRPGDAGRVVRDVGLLQFKNEEGARGTPVAGLPVPVRENLFLIGLSNLAADIERNIELLVRRNWIDLPIRLASGQRAIISFEKGVAGDQVVNDAFRQWQ